MSRPHLATPSELSGLRDLELLARATVEGLRQGLHKSPFHGYSAEFSQYRHYIPGDDLKYVDWKAFARTDRLFTRQFRETTNMAALIVVDVSRSMDFPQRQAPVPGLTSSAAPRTKFELARAVAAILGTLVFDQGDAAGLLAVDDELRFVPARSGHHHLRLFLAQVARLQPTSLVGVQGALRHAARVMTRRGLVIVVSDLYDDIDALAEVRRLARMGHDVIVVHVLSREELGLDLPEAAELVDLETGGTMAVQPGEARAGYRVALGKWLGEVERLVRREGLDYLRLVSGEPLEPALRRFLIGRRGGG